MSLTLDAQRPGMRNRLLVATVVAALAGTYYWWGVLHAAPRAGGDFEVNWIAARAVMHGRDPMAAVAQSGWKWPLYYPMPAQLVAMAFAWMSFVPAECLFVATGAGVLAFGMTREAWWGLLVFLTPSYLHAYYHAQWSPLLTGAMLIPLLGGLLAAKPSIGLACFGSRPSWPAALGAAVLIAASFIVAPHWLADWRGAVHDAPHIISPVLRPGGFLLLAALPFVRRADARLLVGLALVPHIMMFYETVPLFTIPRSFRQMAILVILSSVAAGVMLALPDFPPGYIAFQQGAWSVLLTLLYLPALTMVLFNNRFARARG